MEYSVNIKDDDINKMRDRIASEITDNATDNQNVSKGMVCFAYDPTDSYKLFQEKVKILLKPKEYEQKHCNRYLFYMGEMLSNVILTTNFYQFSVYGYIDRQKASKRFLKLIDEIRPYSKNIKYYDLFLSNLGIATLIVAYMYANDFDNYEMLHKFLENPEFYYQKLDDKFPYCIMERDYTNELDNFPYIAIYDDLEKILFGTEQIKIIK